MSEETEETRLTAYLAQQRTRAAFRQGLRLRLAGSPTERNNLLQRWMPVIKAGIEDGQGVIPDNERD